MSLPIHNPSSHMRATGVMIDGRDSHAAFLLMALAASLAVNVVLGVRLASARHEHLADIEQFRVHLDHDKKFLNETITQIRAVGQEAAP